MKRMRYERVFSSFSALDLSSLFLRLDVQFTTVMIQKFVGAAFF
jgi:hypothetical protein